MTTYRVDPARVEALGERLGELAPELEWTARDTRARSWAIGPGRCRSLLDEVLGDVEHQRLVLGRAMDELGGAVRRAGALYAEVDAEVDAEVAAEVGAQVGAQVDGAAAASPRSVGAGP